MIYGTMCAYCEYKQVVEKIKAVPNEARLLVVDQAADRYFADKGIAISSELSCVQYISCPATKPFTAGYTQTLLQVSVNK